MNEVAHKFETHGTSMSLEIFVRVLHCGCEGGVGENRKAPVQELNVLLCRLPKPHCAIFMTVVRLMRM